MVAPRERATTVQRQLGAKGEASLVLLLEEGQREVEMWLPGRYAVTPQIASALRACAASFRWSWCRV